MVKEALLQGASSGLGRVGSVLMHGSPTNPAGQLYPNGLSQLHSHSLYKSKAERVCTWSKGAHRVTLKPLIKLMQDG